ncbi:sulfatase-like hydrolase/transferase [Ensifer sp. 4252]|uniref:sulfatase-like hydrolase/transferase n=1 Tax=Ensifer sp. 4252 TaxID=3373915 RepID=UPI003D1C7601
MNDTSSEGVSRRTVLLGGTTLAAASGLAAVSTPQMAQAAESTTAKSRPPNGQAPNIVYFLVDNLGYGELGCYGGGILRGADTRRIDGFANEGMKLSNFAPEAQCTPSRAALMTGRYAIRSGNHTVALGHHRCPGHPP